MRVLMIGCGYIGSALGQKLFLEGHEVIGVVRSQQSKDVLNQFGMTSRIADCSTIEGARAACEGGADIVIFSISSKGGDYEKTYLNGMHHVLLALEHQWPSLFFYTSSTSVYAQTDGVWVTEDSAAQPPYANGKILLKTEEYLCSKAEGCFKSYILRLSGIYGPGRHAILDQLREKAEILKGNPKQWINQVHRDDVIQAIRFLMRLKSSKKNCEIFNVTDDTPVQKEDYVKWICQKLKQPIPKWDDRPVISNGMSRKGFQTSRRISNEALRKLGWTLAYPSFREGLENELN